MKTGFAITWHIFCSPDHQQIPYTLFRIFQFNSSQLLRVLLDVCAAIAEH